MAVPKYNEFMKPLLVCLSDGEIHKSKEIQQDLAEYFHLTDEERQELLPGSGQLVYKNRIGWASTYLKKAGLISSPARSIMQITDTGRQVVRENPLAIDGHYLSKFDSFRAFSSPKPASSSQPDIVSNPPCDLATPETPEEQLKQDYEMVLSKLSDDLYEKVMTLSPEKFELLVIDLIRAVGYGYPDESSFRHTGKTGDGGVDGIVQEDKFGFNLIYIQAKHWNENHMVGSKEIRDFYGAMGAGDKSKRGIFVTTSFFTDDAKETSKLFFDRKMILIDRDRLLRLMIENNVGVVPKHSYVLKSVDENLFDDEEG